MKSKTRIALVALVAVALLVAAALLLTRSPGRRGPADPLERLSAQCGGVVVVPDLGRLGERLAYLPKLKLAQLGASLAGYPDAEGLVAELTRAAGIDLRSRDSLLAAGIDPARPLVVYAPASDGPMAAVPFTDRAKLEAFLAKHAETRLAAHQKGSLKVGEFEVTTHLVQGREAPVLGYAAVDGYLFVAAGKSGLQTLQAALQQPAETSLARDARFTAIRARLSANEAFGYVCPGAKGSQLADLAYGAAVGLALSPAEVKLSVDLPLSDAQLSKLASLGTPAGAEMLASLDPKAFLVARSSLDPEALAPYAKALLPRYLARALRQAKVEPSAILAAFEPGVALALTLAPSANLATAPALDPTRTNPFQYFFLQALGRVDDAEQSKAMLGQLLAEAPRFGATITEAEANGVKSWTFNYHLGQGASIALQDKRLLVTGGAGQLEALLARMAAPGAALPDLDPAAKSALEKSGFALYLDVGRLIGAVRALPDSAYGIGGFAIKAAIGRWLDAFEELRSLRVSGGLQERSLRAELVLSLVPPPQQQQANQGAGAK